MTKSVSEPPLDRYRRVAASAARPNRDVVFNALSTAGLTAVVAEYEARSGQAFLSDITASVGDTAAALPSTDVTVHEPYFGDALCAAERALPEGLEWLCEHYLEEGWDPDRTISATCRFDVPSRVITIALHVRHFSVLVYENEY